MEPIVKLKTRIERVLRIQMKQRITEARNLRLYFGPDEFHLRASVSPRGKVGLSLVSDLFDGLSFDQRNELFWSLLDGHLGEDEAEALDFWQMLTTEEAELVYPSLLKRRSPRKNAPAIEGHTTAPLARASSG